MIRIAAEQTRIGLGQSFRARIERSDPAVEHRLFLKHPPVFYTRPLRGWSREDEIEVYLEAPGRYRVCVEWRGPGVDSAWEELALTVTESGGSSSGISLSEVRGHQMWAPTSWDSRVIAGSEKETLSALEGLVRAGDVVYDIGANLGTYSLYFSRRVGSEGRVYCFEANPVCVQFLNANLLVNQAANAEILPVAALDREGTTGFLVNFGNSNLGLSEQSGYFTAKFGQEISVPCQRLDHLIQAYALRPPNLVKLDVEGAEGEVVAGMAETLEAYAPVLILELHGLGPTLESLRRLDAAGYRYLQPGGGEEYATADQVVERFGDAVFQLVAKPSGR